MATAAAWVSAGSAWALESPALMPAIGVVAGDVRWTGDDATGRWSLIAGTNGGAWDAMEPEAGLHLPVGVAQARRAIMAERVSGRVAFDAQRAVLGQRLDVRFHAARAALAIREDGSAQVASVDERARSRLQRTRFGTSLALASTGHSFGIPWDRTIAVHVLGDSLDSRTTVGQSWSGAESDLRRTASAENRVALDARQSWSPWGALRVSAGARWERHGARSSTLDTPTLSMDGSQLSPMLEVNWTPGGSASFFARARRGPQDPSSLMLVSDPWHPAAQAVLDPEARRDMVESGVRLRRGAWETRISAWQARAASGLAFAESAPLFSATSDARHGMELGLRYVPLRGLEMRADLLLDASRPGTGRALPGAARVFGSAGATFRMSRDWDAKLSVSYLGPRDNADEAAALRSTTLANFQVVRWFGRTTRISLDVFNVFDQRARVVDSFVASRAGMLDGTGETFLSSPADPRGFLLKLRTRF